RACCLCALGGIAATSNAAIVGLDMMVSRDGGASWTRSLGVFRGSIVTVGIFTTHDASCFGFGGAVVRINGTGLAAGDLASLVGADARVAPFNFGGSHQAVFASAGAFRIDNAADRDDSPVMGVSISQRDPSSAGFSYASWSHALAYRFTVSIASSGPARDLELFIDQIKNGVMARHVTSIATSGTNTSDWSVSGASIHVVPTPASLALIGAAGVLVERRRR
ncbi:MAG: hypothetical protein AABZ53_10295, partial [Planctomycetota bacterium]